MTDAAKENVKAASSLTVLDDGARPLCRGEIGVYRGLQPLQPNAPVCFADVSDTSLPLPHGTTREQLPARFHVRGRDGQLLSGAPGLPGDVSRAAWPALARPGRPPARCAIEWSPKRDDHQPC